MINKRFSEITADDIRGLIENSIHERKTIEFKQSYSLNSDSEKGEFLADVSSFANASGGDLIFGVREENGTAKELTAFSEKNTDGEKQKIENLLRDGISPRLKVDMEFVAGDNSKFFLILRIQKSWLSPHRVIFTGNSKTKDQFYARNSAGKYRLDVGELRNAFNLSETLTDRIKNFKMQRTSAIIADGTPIPLCSGGKVILHIVPLESFTPVITVNIKELLNTLPHKLKPMFQKSGWGNRLNFDGFVTYAGNAEKESHAYTQLYRSGVIEAVDAAILYEEWVEDKDGNKYIPCDYFETVLIKTLREYLSCLQEIGVNPPLFICITITGVKNFEMGINNRMINFRDHRHKIDRDILSLPEHLLEDYHERGEDILRPMFDVVWNACGYDQSPYFDADGKHLVK